jgi:hypothetical protein
VAEACSLQTNKKPLERLSIPESMPKPPDAAEFLATEMLGGACSEF